MNSMFFRAIIALFNTFLFFMISSAAHAQEETNNTEIKVTGNTRTSSSFIIYNTKKCLENTEESNNQSFLNNIKQCLLNTQLFTKVDITQSQKDILLVNVEDRWTLLPIPFASTNSDGHLSAGLLLLESNFLGLGKNIGVGGIYSSTGNNVFGFYKDNNVFFTNWRFGLFADTSQQQIYLYRRDDTIDGFTATKSFGSVSVGYQLVEDLTVDTSFQATKIQTKTLDNYKLNPGDVDTNALGLKIHFKNSDYKLYYQNGFDITGNVSTQISRTDNNSYVTQETTKAQYSKETFANEAFLVLLQAGKTSGGNIADFFELGNTPGFRGIPQFGAWANSYISLDTEYLIPLKIYESGIWTAAAFGEAGILNAYSYGAESKLDYESYGVGTYYFFKKIALPGFGLEIGHNTRFQTFFTSASIGLNLN